MNNIIKGSYGEKIARDHLIENKYQILEQNLRNNLGEIDIIAKKDNIIVFIEVKSRSTINYGFPYEAVNYRKQSKIINVANTYIKLKKLKDYQFRFDIIEIFLKSKKINHIENAFWS